MVAADKIEFFLYDVFGTRPFSGNPANVILKAADLSVSQMQTIAAELSTPACAFIQEFDRENLYLKIFSPTSEVETSAHAVVAACHSLYDQGLLEMPKENMHLNVYTKGGKQRVLIEKQASGAIEVELFFELIKFYPFGYSRDLLAGTLGLSRSDIPEGWPLMKVHCGRSTLIVPVEKRDSLDKARPDYESLAQLNSKIEVASTLVYSRSAKGEFYCRVFSPRLGVFESSVSGSASAALAALHIAEGACELTPPKTKLTAEQGHSLGRAGRVDVEVSHGDHGIDRIGVSGPATMVASGEILAPGE
jgi:trans-2,3-dihydro-3-hydroxyanthranilate isomerase